MAPSKRISALKNQPQQAASQHVNNALLMFNLKNIPHLQERGVPDAPGS